MDFPGEGDAVVVFLRYLVATRGDQLLARWLSVLYGHTPDLFHGVAELMRILLTLPMHITFDGTSMHLFASLAPFITIRVEDLDEQSGGVFRSLFKKRHVFTEKYCRQLALYVDMTPLIERLFGVLLLASPRGAFMGVFESLQLTLQKFEIEHWTPKVHSLRGILKHAHLLYYQHDGHNA